MKVLSRALLSVFLLVALQACSKTEMSSGSPTVEPVSMSEAAPFGSWPSPITAESLEEGARGIWSVSKDGEHLYWLESRPDEGGRATVMRWREGEPPQELLSEPWNVRTRVHEYGGGALLVHSGVLWFSNFADQRLYRMSEGQEPVAITPDAALRYAGCTVDEKRQRLLCIREDHRGLQEPVNTLVALPMDVPGETAEGEVLFSGTDFVSAPRVSPSGDRVAFTAWMHPNMPWDNTVLHSAEFAADGALSNLLAHNPDSTESVVDPSWTSAGELLALSDRSNWWAPYRVSGRDFTPIDTGLENVEIGGPGWSINSRYVFALRDGGMLAVARRGSIEELYLLNGEGSKQRIDMGAVGFGSVVEDGDALFLTAGFPDRPAELVKVNRRGEILMTVRQTRDEALDSKWVPAYRPVSFPLTDGGEAHGVYYPPQNPDVVVPTDSGPPLIVAVHGGPTSVAAVGYDPGFYYWTSRGFAILDLNYRGSTGFGRKYRHALYKQWGIADVEDATAGALWLATQGLADPEKLIIRGGSAGGYTTLAAHAFFDTFAAGASYFGVSDIEALAKDTHKFESRYLDQLIGPYPERRDLYVDRSPIHHLEGFGAPLILLQGLDDPIVPPNQSEAIYEALKERGVPTAYLPFEGESHGFRKSENRIAAREAELYFYAKVLGLQPADALPAIPIDNLTAASPLVD